MMRNRLFAKNPRVYCMPAFWLYILKPLACANVSLLSILSAHWVRGHTRSLFLGSQCIMGFFANCLLYIMSLVSNKRCHVDICVLCCLSTTMQISGLFPWWQHEMPNTHFKLNQGAKYMQCSGESFLSSVHTTVFTINPSYEFILQLLPAFYLEKEMSMLQLP